MGSKKVRLVGGVRDGNTAIIPESRVQFTAIEYMAYLSCRVRFGIIRCDEEFIKMHPTLPSTPSTRYIRTHDIVDGMEVFKEVGFDSKECAVKPIKKEVRAERSRLESQKKGL